MAATTATTKQGVLVLSFDEYYNVGKDEGRQYLGLVLLGNQRWMAYATDAGDRAHQTSRRDRAHPQLGNERAPWSKEILMVYVRTYVWQPVSKHETREATAATTSDTYAAFIAKTQLEFEHLVGFVVVSSAIDVNGDLPHELERRAQRLVIRMIGPGVLDDILSQHETRDERVHLGVVPCVGHRSGSTSSSNRYLGTRWMGMIKYALSGRPRLRGSA